MVVGSVGVERVRSLSRTAGSTSNGWDGLNQRHELGDVVAVAAGQRHLQRDAVRFGDQMVFRAGAGTADRARSGSGPPLSARIWDRQQRLNPRPQLVGDDPGRPLTLPHIKINKPDTPTYSKIILSGVLRPGSPGAGSRGAITHPHGT